MKERTKSHKSKQENASSKKGFGRDILTAIHFGFSPVETPHITKEDSLRWKGFKDPIIKKELEEDNPFSFNVVEKAALLRTYIEKKWEDLPHPFAICFHKPLVDPDRKQKPSNFLGLEIFGFPGSTAEAIVLRTCLSILEEEGFRDLEISWNSIGDKDSVQDYERMLNTYTRKNLQLMPGELRKEIKESVFEVARTDDPQFEKWRMEAPKSMSFLTEASRSHVKEVLEYIESFEIPYSINSSLIGCPEFTSHIAFEIKSEGVVLAHGYRYSRLSKRLGFKRELPALGATIALKKKDKEVLKQSPRPRFYLVQLGFGAKIQTLKTLETLRLAKIPVAHALMKDKMQSQMGTAENMKIPYMLLVGQREAIEKSVVVRDVNTRVQETIPLIHLVDYLKKLP